MKTKTILNLLASAVFASSSFAVDYTWVFGGSDNYWTSTSNWTSSGGTYPSFNTDTATFTGASGTIQLDADITLQKLNYANNKITITSASNVLTFDANTTSGGYIQAISTSGVGALTLGCDVVMNNTGTGAMQFSQGAQTNTQLNFLKSVTLITSTSFGNGPKFTFQGSVHLNNQLSYASSNNTMIFSGSNSTASGGGITISGGGVAYSTTGGAMYFNSTGCVAVDYIVASNNAAANSFVTLNWGANNAVKFESDSYIQFGNGNTGAAASGATMFKLNMNGYSQEFGDLRIVKGKSNQLDQQFIIDIGGVIDNGDGTTRVSALIFEDSSANAWNAGHTLNIANWDDSAMIAFVIDSGTGLSDIQKEKIYINGVALTVGDWSTGTLGDGRSVLYYGTLIPEPSELAALLGLVALGFAAYRRRK